MKAPILALLTILSLSANAFAAEKGQPISAAQKSALVKAVLEEPMVRAAVKWNHHLAATCTHEVLSAVNNGNDAFDFAMRVDCNLPDGDQVGGGSTMYFIKGLFIDSTAILNSIAIDRAG